MSQNMYPSILVWVSFNCRIIPSDIEYCLLILFCSKLLRQSYCCEVYPKDAVLFSISFGSLTKLLLLCWVNLTPIFFYLDKFLKCLVRSMPVSAILALPWLGYRNNSPPGIPYGWATPLQVAAAMLVRNGFLIALTLLSPYTGSALAMVHLKSRPYGWAQNRESTIGQARICRTTQMPMHIIPY